MQHTYTIEDFLNIKSASLPQWSPDGLRVAYSSNQSGTFQLYITDRDGKNTEQLTDYADSLNSISFSPVHNEIIYTKSEGGDERNQIFLLNLTTNETRALTQNKNAKYKFSGWSHDGTCITFASNERNGKDFDVYFMDVVTGNTTCIFDKGGSCSSLGFSPSDKHISICRTYSATNEELYIFNLETHELTEIQSPGEERSVSFPHWLHNESGFYFITEAGRDFAGLAYYEVASKLEQYVLNPNWNVEGASISQDGKYLLVWVNVDGYYKLTMYETVGMKPCTDKKLPEGMIHYCAWSPDGNYLVVTQSDPRTSTNVCIWSVESGEYWPITDMPQGVPKEEMVEPELLHYESFDKLVIPAFQFSPQTKPEKNNAKAPVIIFIHGGPEAQFTPSFNSLIQYLTYKGYVVIAPNIRGSRGYGKIYQSLDDIEKRLDSIKDIASIHEYIKTRSDLDASKVFLWGASYGGYAVLAGLAFFPKLWAGGVDIVGMSNLVTFLENTASYRRALREVEYGWLEHDRALLESLSPIHKVDDIVAPLLIIHGANDPRVPLSEAQQMHNKLIAKGAHSELLVYYDEGHGISKLPNRIEAYTKAVNFLDSIACPV